jgi:hypothetical protein
VRRAYAGYWVANDVSFISGDRVTVSAIGTNRNQPDVAGPGTSPSAWIFVPPASVAGLSGQLGSTAGIEPGTISEAMLTAWLSAHGIAYRTVRSGGFDVVLPARNVHPAQIGG